MIDLSGKVAMITGSSRDIGRGCALEMARAGADICVNYHSHGDEAQQVAEEVRTIGRRTIVVQADVSDHAAVDRMVVAVVDKLGHLDVAACNAYYNRRQPFLEIDLDDMRRTWDVILWGTFHTAQSVALQMVRQGRDGSMVFISSLLAFIPYPTSMAYNAAKAAVDHMAATIAGELTGHSIRVNCIQPGWTDTPGER